LPGCARGLVGESRVERRTGIEGPYRTLITTIVATPIMTYGLLPWMTKRFEWWLHPTA
jgi:antibiotic biosynthesis monooxygenase (ABM) superfamily enzyme